MGTHDRAPNGVSFERFVSCRLGRKICQPGHQPAATNIHQVGGTAHPRALAAGSADPAGDRAGPRRNAAGRLAGRLCRAAEMDRSLRRVSNLRHASGIWKDEHARLAHVGLPSRGSSSAAVWRVTTRGRHLSNGGLACVRPPHPAHTQKSYAESPGWRRVIQLATARCAGSSLAESVAITLSRSSGLRFWLSLNFPSSFSILISNATISISIF